MPVGPSMSMTVRPCPVAAATFADVRLGAPTEVFSPTTVLHADETFVIDPAAALVARDL